MIDFFDESGTGLFLNKSHKTSLFLHIWRAHQINLGYVYYYNNYYCYHDSEMRIMKFDGIKLRAGQR